jgi:Tol biopolymer transport system component
VTDSDPTVSPRPARAADDPALAAFAAPVNSPADETQSSLSANGTLLFESNRAEGAGQADLWISTAPDYRTVTHLPDTINTTAYEASPFIAPDERYLLFTRDAIPHIAVRQGAGWAPPQRIHIPGYTRIKRYILSLRITTDEQWLYFTSDGEDSRDVFRVRFDAIGLTLPPKP